MKTTLTSKERLLYTMEGLEVDHLPLCFDGPIHGWVQFVRDEIPDPFRRAEFFLEQGLDTAVCLNPCSEGPVIPLTSEQTELVIMESCETPAGEPFPVLSKNYVTRQGTLRQVVRKSEDYPYDFIWLFNDLNLPASRSIEYLIKSEEDLDAFRAILTVPDKDELRSHYEFAREVRKFCDKRGLLMSAYLMGVGDPLGYVLGIERAVLSALDEPEFIAELIQIISDWDLKRMEQMIDMGADVIVRRGWYESTDFWSPGLYRDLFQKPLQREIDICHQAGVKYTYCMDTGVVPLLDNFRELMFDMLCNVEPEHMAAYKAAIGDKITLAGGVNNFHVLERGTDAEVEQAVRNAVENLAPGGRFILTPGDSILAVNGRARQNFQTMIKAWRSMLG